MSPLLDSSSYSLRPVRNPLIRSALQQRRKKPLVESDSHNRAGPSPDWGPPRSRTGQPLKVVAGLSLVCPGLDLLVAHATSVEKVLTHGNIVYETRSQSLPLYRNTQQPATTESDKDPALCQPAVASELLPAVALRWPQPAIYSSSSWQSIDVPHTLHITTQHNTPRGRTRLPHITADNSTNVPTKERCDLKCNPV